MLAGTASSSSSSSAAARTHDHDGDKAALVEVPRYIPLPDHLYALRHRFPGVTECLLLECTRCCRWVLADVRCSVPEEVSTDAVRADVVSRRRLALSSTRQARAAARKPAPVEWHSQRIRDMESRHFRSSSGNGHAENETDDADDNVELEPEKKLLASLIFRGASSKPGVSNAEKRQQREVLYIPNPVTFTCTWIDCEKKDLLADLRVEWLGELQSALTEKGGRTPRSEQQANAVEPEETIEESDTLAESPLESLHKNRVALNEGLAKELGVRRSSRLAGRGFHSTRDPLEGSVPSSSESTLHPSTRRAGVSVGGDGSDDNDSDDTRRAIGSGDGRTKWARAAAQRMVHSNDEAALLSAFCWIVCERCGKIRRTAQPFPGGAPFVCALSASAGSACETPEEDALIAYASQYEAATLCPRVTEDFPHAELSFSVVRAELQRQLTCSTRSQRRNLLEELPALKELTTCVRRKALGPFMKQLMLAPAAIRQKRDEVLRASLHASATPSPPTAPVMQPTKIVEEAQRTEDTQELELSRAKNAPEMDGGDSGCGRPRKKRCRSAEVDVALTQTLPRRASAASPTARPLPPAPRPRGGRPKQQRDASEAVATADSGVSTALISPNYSLASLTQEDVAMQSLGVSDLPATEHKRRGRAKGSSKQVAKEDVIYWVQCDACEKWRIVPRPIPSATRHWVCSMREDRLTSCADPEDEEQKSV